MDRKYLKTSELGDLTPLCKLPPHALWRFCSEPDKYEVEVIVNGRMVIASGRHDNPHQAVSETIRQWRELPEEVRERG